MLLSLIRLHPEMFISSKYKQAIISLIIPSSLIWIPSVMLTMLKKRQLSAIALTPMSEMFLQRNRFKVLSWVQFFAMLHIPVSVIGPHALIDICFKFLQPFARVFKPLSVILITFWPNLVLIQLPNDNSSKLLQFCPMDMTDLSDT